MNTSQKTNAPGKGAFEETSGTQQTEAPSRVILPQHRPNEKQFATAQAQFARLGYELKSKHHPVGLTLFEVSRHRQTRVFSCWHDVHAFLAQVGG